MNTVQTGLRRTSLNRGNLPPFSGVPTASEAPRRQPMRQLRAVRRIAGVLLFVFPALGVQAILLRLPGRQKVTFAAFFWHAIARLLGLHVRVIGRPLRQQGSAPGRPIIYVCNHSSWLDIPAVGGIIYGRFVAKDDVAGWPIISLVARLGRTVFVTRNRQGTLRERDEMQDVLEAGDDLILFPEGTSSDGSRVLPFRSAFFAAAYGSSKPVIQPVSVVYDRLAGLPVSHASRDVFAWYGDMSLAPHAWQVAQWGGKRATLLFHAPLDPADFPNRKVLAQTAWQAVADGAAALRQNRPARPLPDVVEAPQVAQPAYA